MLKAMDHEYALQLIGRIDPKFRKVWENRPFNDQIALAQYFLPHGSNKPIIGPTRPRIVKWYCPFASQNNFPSGHRYCVNVYTGCSHQCTYCYAAGYEPECANSKKSFEKLIQNDMEDLERFDVPPAPIHLSNSTDPFQPLEKDLGHTRFALEQILKHRHRFTTVTILTKNPLLPVQLGYVELFKALLDYQPDHSGERKNRISWPGFVVEVSVAFWQENARSFYDPGAPTVKHRIEGIEALHQAKIPIVLRIDPLFPRSPVTGTKNMFDFGLPEAQTLEDLGHLASLAREIEAKHIVYSVAKIVQPRGRKLSSSMRVLRDVYASFAVPEKLIWQGGSWRLPYTVANEKIIEPFLDICEQKKIPAKFCMQNLIETP